MKKVQFGFARANSLTPKNMMPLLVAGIVAWGIGAWGHFYATPQTITKSSEQSASAAVASGASAIAQQIGQTAPVQAAAQLGSMAAAAIAPKPERVERQVEMASRQSFAGLLTDADVNEADANNASAALNKVYNLRKIKAGQEFTLGFIRQGNEETLQSVVFDPELTKEVTLTRTANGFSASVKETPIERERVAVRAVIKSSLYEAGERQGIPHSIMAGLLRIYAHEIDFQRDIQPGDRFEVLYDQPTAHDGTPVGEGTIIYAAMEVAGKVRPIYRVTFADGTVDYLNADGKSIRRSLLRTPVDGAHVTSTFGMRMHPLLGFSKMHKGVDFGAAPGTPIFAAGSGVVEEVGFKSGYGRYIRLRHNGNTETAYAHMSRFARSVYSGARVNQGDVIGFVGSSGRATGPHLHFEVLVNHQQVNPMNASNMPTGRSLEGTLLGQFKQGQGKIRNEFSTLLTKQAEEERQENAQAAVVPAAAPNAAYPSPQSSASCGLRGGC